MNFWKNCDELISFIEIELGIESGSISERTHFRSISVWSSINALYLMTRISEESGLFLSSAELASCETIEDIYQNLVAKLDV